MYIKLSLPTGVGAKYLNSCGRILHSVVKGKDVILILMVLAVAIFLDISQSFGSREYVSGQQVYKTSRTVNAAPTAPLIPPSIIPPLFIAYHDVTNRDLKVAKCTDAACSNAIITTVDSAGDVGRWASITSP